MEVVERAQRSGGAATNDFWKLLHAFGTAGVGKTEITATGVIRGEVSRAHPERRIPSPLTRAAAALRTAWEDLEDDAQWLEVAQILREVAISERSRSPRHAGVALNLSDALMYTSPRQLEEREKAMGAVVRGYRLLLSEFVPLEEDQKLVQSLAENGWRLSAPFEDRLFSGQ